MRTPPNFSSASAAILSMAASPFRRRRGIRLAPKVTLRSPSGVSSQRWRYASKIR
jgi:hypothetical protein